MGFSGQTKTFSMCFSRSEPVRRCKWPSPLDATADTVLVATGRRPFTAGLGLEALGVEMLPRGQIKTDHFATSVPGIYAIGDVIVGPMLAHKATREAKIAVETLLGEPVEFDNIAIPAVVFTDPELAWAGITARAS